MVLLLVAFAVPRTLAACLLKDYSVSAEFSRSELVVTGTVISERTVSGTDMPDFIGGTYYVVKVRESFRGPARNRVEIFSENSSGRFPLQKGTLHILFLYSQDGSLSADNCGNSGRVNEKSEVLDAVRRLAIQKVSATATKPGN